MLLGLRPEIPTVIPVPRPLMPQVAVKPYAESAHIMIEILVHPKMEKINHTDVVPVASVPSSSHAEVDQEMADLMQLEVDLADWE